MGFIQLGYDNGYRTADKERDLCIRPGEKMETAFTSSFIDRRGNWRYVPSCGHFQTAPEILEMDGILENIFHSASEGDTGDDCWYIEMDMECECIDEIDGVSELEALGYIHVSIVSTGSGFEFNFYTQAKPNQSQIDTLWDFYLSTPDTPEFRVQAGGIIDDFLAGYGIDPLINIDINS